MNTRWATPGSSSFVAGCMIELQLHLHIFPGKPVAACVGIHFCESPQRSDRIRHVMVTGHAEQLSLRTIDRSGIQN